MGLRPLRLASREEQIAVVESYFDCCVRKDFEAMPITSDYTMETPLTARLSGQAAVGYLKAAAQQIKRIRIKQLIVEGAHVAVLFEEETSLGQSVVFAKLELENGRVKSEVAFYDPRKLVGAMEVEP